MARSEACRVAASRADGQTVCVHQQYTERGVFAGLLPEPNGEPDVEEQSSVERAERMNGFLIKLQSFPSETHGFIRAPTEYRP